jgi:membrane protease subunit HflK
MSDQKNDGPPDLEEVWQRLTRQLRALLPGRPALGGGGPQLRHAGPVLGALAVLLVAVWLLSGFFTVQEGSAGVVTQFGAYKYTTGSGLWYHLPQPIQADQEVSIANMHSVEVGGAGQFRTASQKDQSMLTADENIVDVRFTVQYRVSDAAKFLFNDKHSAIGSESDNTVTEAGESAIRAIVGSKTMEQVFAAGPAEIDGQLQQSIQAILDSYQSGLVVNAVTLHPVQPPEQVQASFDDAVKALQDRDRMRSEGQAYANDVVPRARGDAARLVTEAEGHRAQVVGEAQGDADRFKKVLAEYAKAPGVTRERMYLETMQDILSHTTKVLIDGKSTSNTINLPPIDKIAKDSKPETGPVAPASAPAAPPASAGAPATPAFPSSVDSDRSRDPQRARERETR